MRALRLDRLHGTLPSEILCTYLHRYCILYPASWSQAVSDCRPVRMASGGRLATSRVAAFHTILYEDWGYRVGEARWVSDTVESSPGIVPSRCQFATQTSTSRIEHSTGPSSLKVVLTSDKTPPSRAAGQEPRAPVHHSRSYKKVGRGPVHAPGHAVLCEWPSYPLKEEPECSAYASQPTG